MNNSRPRLDWLITELDVMGGAESFVRNLAPLLLKRGWDIRVITFSRGGVLVNELRQEGVPLIELGIRHKSLPLPLIDLIRLWQTDPPDLVHTHLYHAGIAGRLIAGVFGIRPVIVHQHGAEQARSHLRSLLDRYTAKLVSRYVVTCQAVAQILATREKIAISHISVIYNGLSSQQTTLSTPPAGWSIPEGAFSLGCVGRLSPEKGQDTLIRALSLLVGEGIPVHLVLAGDGESLPSLRQLTSQLSLEENVHLIGIRRDIYTWLPFFDLFVLPSRWEGISMALLEAMSVGLPVVATAVGGTPEVIGNNAYGVLVPPDNPPLLAEIIKDLLLNPMKREVLGKDARQRVESAFTIEATVSALEDLYHDLLNQKGYQV